MSRTALAAAGIGIAVAAATVAGAPAASAVPHGPVARAAHPIAGQYVVSLEPGARHAAKELTRRHGGVVVRTFSATFNGFLVKNLSERQARRLAADPAVRSVHQDGRARAAGEQLDPPSWGLDQADQQTLNPDRKYAYPNTADGVTAYVIDSGVARDHPEFEGRASYGPDYIGNDPDSADCNGHGTHVAGTIAGKNVGVAKKAKVVALRVLDCGGIVSAVHTGGYATKSGTSMAAPHLAGTAAMDLHKNPALTPQQVQDRMVRGATPGLVTDPGPGSPNKLLWVGYI
ncbi:S8 family serine peptidase [Spirillospora sp. CA-294931]|uniref:S8 family serine peptidase n=1 Tax=Spirillospora sp. CA-294931 TaxID=3240042 RepID=UPI003D938A9A